MWKKCNVVFPVEIWMSNTQNRVWFVPMSGFMQSDSQQIGNHPLIPKTYKTEKECENRRTVFTLFF